MNLSPGAKLALANYEKANYLADYLNFTWGSFVDNNNGTVTFTGAGSYAGQTLTFLKCSQGQTCPLGKTGSTCGTGTNTEYVWADAVAAWSSTLYFFRYSERSYKLFD